LSALEVEAELIALEEGTIDPATFPHREHVRLGFEMLSRHSFAEAAARFARGLRRVATKAGRPEVYNETITMGFLAVIGERQARQRCGDWAEFIARNEDLADKQILERWYGAEFLKSDVALKTFCLPAAREVFL
jgi:hypothetical protein